MSAELTNAILITLAAIIVVGALILALRKGKRNSTASSSGDQGSMLT